jgi:hypothetical protein
LASLPPGDSTSSGVALQPVPRRFPSESPTRPSGPLPFGPPAPKGGATSQTTSTTPGAICAAAGEDFGPAMFRPRRHRWAGALAMTGVVVVGGLAVARYRDRPIGSDTQQPATVPGPPAPLPASALPSPSPSSTREARAALDVGPAESSSAITQARAKPSLRTSGPRSVPAPRVPATAMPTTRPASAETTFLPPVRTPGF